MPSRPVAERAARPGSGPRRAESTSRSTGSAPRQSTLTRGAGVALEGQLATMVGTPTEFRRTRSHDHASNSQRCRPSVTGENSGPSRRAGERHGENVRRIPPTRGRTLVGSMAEGVVALDADGDRDAVAGVDDPDSHLGPPARGPSVGSGAGARATIVGTVLAPHHRIQGELERVRLPTRTSITTPTRRR